MNRRPDHGILAVAGALFALSLVVMVDARSNPRDPLWSYQVAIGDGSVPGTRGLHMVGRTSEAISASEDHLKIQTTKDDKTIRLNSRGYDQATGDSIGFQSKPDQDVTTTGSVYGGQVSPRCSGAVACANLIGLEVSPILQGTSGAVSGDWRGVDVILEDGGAGRTISGDAAFMRIRPNLSSTVTGDVQIVKAITAEGSTNYELFGTFPAVTGVFVAPGNTTALTNAGHLKIKIGTTAYRIPVLEDE